MPVKRYHPTDAEYRQGEEGYLRYATGITVLSHPFDMQPLHGVIPNKNEVAQLEQVVFYAEDLMYEGIQKVIRYSHPAQIRTSLADLESRFASALPYMFQIIDRTYEKHHRRIQALNPALDLLRPMVMTDETIYKLICHSRRGKILTTRLMDGVLPHPLIAPIVANKLVKSQELAT